MYVQSHSLLFGWEALGFPLVGTNPVIYPLSPDSYYFTTPQLGSDAVL